MRRYDDHPRRRRAHTDVLLSPSTSAQRRPARRLLGVAGVRLPADCFSHRCSSAPWPATVPRPDQDVGATLDAFDADQVDTLTATARGTGQVLGTLGEAYTARR